MIETLHTREVCSTKTLAFGFLISALAVCLALPAVSFGQASAGTGSISGVLTDPSGAVVPGANIVISSDAQGTLRTLKTNDAGLFTAPALTPGPGYRVS